jgi:DHA1 family tetracycline resistance protein-like MFS transporter
VGLLFTYLGLLVAVVQGGLIGMLVRAFGESRLVVVAAVSYGAGLLIMGLSGGWPMAIFGITFTAIGSALFNPSMSSLVSQQAGAQERGLVIGVFQSATWLGRSAGPLLAGLLFARVGVDAPLLTGAALLLPCLALIFVVRHRMHQQNIAAAAGLSAGA